MTPTEINRRVAMLCGWTTVTVGGREHWKSPAGVVGHCHPWYTEDYHACRDILKHVEAECGVKIAFMNTLESLIAARSNGPCDVSPWDYLLVEPEMLCQAFLIVKGEWVE